MTRFALLTRGGEPHLWDFGSAAKHHRLYCPWLPPENIRGGMIGLRGAVAPEAGLFTGAAKEIAEILRAEGVADMPIGVDLVEPPMLAALEAENITVRDGQQTMLDAREVKSADEIMLLNIACAMVDGAYQLIAERLKPGVRESQLVAEVTKALFDMGSEHVDNINAVSGERCSARTPTSSAIGSSAPATRPSSTSSRPSSATRPATTAPSSSAWPATRNATRTSGHGSGSTRASS